MRKLRCLPALFAFSLLLTANSCSNESRGQEDVKKRVFISTDMAAGLVGGWRSGPPDTDDSWAVELISTYAGAVVEGAAVVRGNGLQPAELYAAKRTFIETPGFWNGPIFAGGIEPLPAPDPVMWTGDAGSPVTLFGLCMNEGALALADLLARSKEPVTILAIGPLTDIVRPGAVRGRCFSPALHWQA
jgi:inosine-uridine nucleoside N-ribohydrolase